MPYRARDLVNNLNRFLSHADSADSADLTLNIGNNKNHENPFIQVEGCASDAMAICFSSYASIRIKTYTHTLNPL